MYVGPGENYSLREHSYTVPVAKFDHLMSDLDLFFARFRRVVSSDILVVPLRDEGYRHMTMLPNDPVNSPLDSPQRQEEVLGVLGDQKILLYCTASGRREPVNIATIYEDGGAITVEFNSCDDLPVDPADLDHIVSRHCAGIDQDKPLNTQVGDGASRSSTPVYRAEHCRARHARHSRSAARR